MKYLKKSPNVLIVGFGSSGQRFAKIISSLGFNPVIYRHRSTLNVLDYQTIDNFNTDLAFKAAIIACSTSQHLSYINQLAAFNLPLLVDKPLGDNLVAAKKVCQLVRNKKINLAVGFNLRLLPIVEVIRQKIKKQDLGEIIAADFYVGQYLPGWRPDTDYTQSYSSHHDQGGGVALDLIHEIDLAYHFFPDVNFDLSWSDKISDLKIDTEDIVILQTKSKPLVTVRLDYLNHLKTRTYTFIGTKGSLKCDVINKNMLLIDLKGEINSISDPNFFDVPQTYIQEVKRFLEEQDVINSKDVIRDLGIDALSVALKVRKHVPEI